MKKYFLSFVTLISISLYAQQGARYSAVYSDPAITNIRFTDLTNTLVNSDNLTVGHPVEMQFTISNNDRLNRIPAGTSQVVITLGSNFLLGTDLSNSLSLPLKDYFKWQAQDDPEGNQLIIYGDIYRDLPANFTGEVKFNLIPDKEGSSTVTCQFTISNHKNPSVVLSDIAPQNNFVFQSYTNRAPIGIKFVQFDAMVRGCMIDLNWAISDEKEEAKNFFVETSEDGIHFNNIKTIHATGSVENNILLETQGHSNLYIRIKAENANGQFVYSKKAFVNNICNTRFEVTLYPSLVESQVNEVILLAKKGIFNGKYNIRLLDMHGNEIRKIEINTHNQIQVKFKTGFITAGNYYINLTGENGAIINLKMVKQ